MITHVTMHIITDMRNEQTTIIFQIVSVYVDCILAYQLKAETFGSEINAFGSEVDAFDSKADALFRNWSSDLIEAVDYLT